MNSRWRAKPGLSQTIIIDSPRRRKYDISREELDTAVHKFLESGGSIVELPQESTPVRSRVDPLIRFVAPTVHYVEERLDHSRRFRPDMY